jgi:hypothetical protein
MRAPYIIRPQHDRVTALVLNPALPVPRIDRYPQRAHIDQSIRDSDRSLSQPLFESAQ